MPVAAAIALAVTFSIADAWSPEGHLKHPSVLRAFLGWRYWMFIVALVSDSSTGRHASDAVNARMNGAPVIVNAKWAIWNMHLGTSSAPPELYKMSFHRWASNVALWTIFAASCVGFVKSLMHALTSSTNPIIDTRC
jgi:hypothetical protein